MAASSSGRNDDASLYAVLAYVLVFTLLGLPLWWKTTDVYRVPLPYNEIQQLSNFQMTHAIPVTVILALPNSSASHLLDELMHNMGNSTCSTHSEKLSFCYKWTFREATDKEMTIISTAHTLADAEEMLQAPTLTDDIGKIWMYILPPDYATLSEQIIVGFHRTVFLSADHDAHRLVQHLLLVAKAVVREDSLSQFFIQHSVAVKSNKDDMRSLRTTPAIDITFSLICPQLHIFDLQWNIESAVEAYVEPFLKKFSIMMDFDVKSQMLFMVSLNIQPTFDSKTLEHVLTTDQLSLVINPVEAKLGSHASLNPTLNFVVYIPPQEQTPLQIYDITGVKLTSNAFLSPQWGGFLIYNAPSESNSTVKQLHLKMDHIMDVFLAQLHLLLGLPEKMTQGMNLTYLPASIPSDFDLDFLLRRHAQDQIAMTSSSLNSLSQLLGTIGNIVIKDEIGDHVYLAISSIHQCLSLLNKTQLYEAFQHAKNAFIKSEKAFFDPSLLSLLYFPDDQKYAIYIPLFLPVSLPVIMSLKNLWNLLKQRKHEKID